MKIAVLGAGIIGVTTAFELALAGHEVTVFDRCSSVAEEASFANGGLLSPAYVNSWSDFDWAAKTMRYFFAKHSPTQIGWSLSWQQLMWLRQKSKQIRHYQHSTRLEALGYLATRSLHRFQEICDQYQLELERTKGLTVLARTKDQMSHFEKNFEKLDQLGLDPQLLLDADDIRAKEPGLSSTQSLVAALYLPTEETVNTRQFAAILKNLTDDLSVQWKFNQTISHITPGKQVLIYTDKHPEGDIFDAAVLCTGNGSNELLKKINVHLPMQAVFGYSISAPIRDINYSPMATIIDDKYKVSISKVGTRIRASGITQLGAHTHSMSKKALATLYQTMSDWFPGGASIDSRVQQWMGARPTMVDGLPVIGQVGQSNIWLNLGHGNSGWSLACGSAQCIVEQIEQKKTALDLAPFQLRH